MIKHPIVRILSCGILVSFLFGTDTLAAQTPTVSVESNYTNEQNNSSFAGHTQVINSIFIENKIKNTINKKGYTTTSVNVRKEPNINSKKLNTYKINTEIQYRKYNDDWAMILYENQIAFIAIEYISDTKVKEETYQVYSYSGSKLTKSKGVNNGPSGKETYYNLNMSGVVQIMRNQGYNYSYWIREDGVKMFGNYVIVAADLSIRPRGSLVPTSLGMGIVCDTGTFIYSNRTQIDIAVSWN